MPGIDSYTKIMLHFDGSDAGTTFTDSSASAHTFTGGGNAQLDTAFKKFGTAALLCDGSGDYITTNDSSDFTLDLSDWTVDFWFNLTVAGGLIRRAFGQGDSSNTTSLVSIHGGIDENDFVSATINSGSASATITGTTAITTSGWHHYALVRTGNVIKLFLDGVQEGGDLSFTLAVNDSAYKFSIGRLGETAANYWRGSIDEFRLSVGIARWTSNFTPESAAYTSLQTITGALFTNTQTFYGASTLPVEAVFGALFTNTQEFFVSQVARVGDPPGPITEIYRRTSARKRAF